MGVATPNYYYAAPVCRRSAAIIPGIRAHLRFISGPSPWHRVDRTTSSIHETVNDGPESMPLRQDVTAGGDRRRGRDEPTSDAGHTTAGVSPTADKPDQISDFREEWADVSLTEAPEARRCMLSSLMDA